MSRGLHRTRLLERYIDGRPLSVVNKALRVLSVHFIIRDVMTQYRQDLKTGEKDSTPGNNNIINNKYDLRMASSETISTTRTPPNAPRGLVIIRRDENKQKMEENEWKNLEI